MRQIEIKMKELIFFFIISSTFLFYGQAKDIKDYNIFDALDTLKDISRTETEKVSPNDVTYRLYTRSSNIDFNSSTNLDKTKKTIIVIHGYIEDKSVHTYKTMIGEYLKAEDVNVIQVDWGQPARDNYRASAYNTRLVADIVTNMIIDKDIDPDLLHIVGHSLGAHVGGFIGKGYYKRKGRKVEKITGLDPAGPAFTSFLGPKKAEDRLDKTDAKIVVALHTDAGFYGLDQSVGTLDIYFNTGSRSQPGCLQDLTNFGASIGKMIAGTFCSHTRSCTYFIESISRAYHCTMCDNYINFLAGLCAGNPEYVITAEGVTSDMVGSCFVKTGDKEPYF